MKGPLKLSEEPVFKVRGAEGIGYLRLVAGETYTGDSWLRSEEQTEAASPGAALPLPSIRWVTAYIVLATIYKCASLFLVRPQFPAIFQRLGEAPMLPS